MDTLTAIKTRRSIRKYAAKPVSRKDIETMVDAGRLAASAKNRQPWEFVVITNSENLKKLKNLVLQNAPFLDTCAGAIVVTGHEEKYYLVDGSAATQNILIAATALGIGTCWIAGAGKPYEKDVLEFIEAPGKQALVSIVAFGYPDETPNPPKRPLKEVLHREKF
jgi:nitroreductase